MGVGFLLVATLLGHSTRKAGSTPTYVHFFDPEVRAAAGLVAERIWGLVGGS